ncbi:MAG: FtsX-like permease family protein [Rhodospirillales bacterium]
MAEVLKIKESSAGALALLVAAIASVSLIVGGIGIMNIMLVSVVERTREIGIRMAVSARRRDILSQFLVEAVTLSVIGGLIGIALEVISSLTFATFAEWPFIFSLQAVLLAVGFSITVGGVVFGFYPARRASRGSILSKLCVTVAVTGNQAINVARAPVPPEVYPGVAGSLAWKRRIRRRIGADARQQGGRRHGRRCAVLHRCRRCVGHDHRRGRWPRPMPAIPVWKQPARNWRAPTRVSQALAGWRPQAAVHRRRRLDQVSPAMTARPARRAQFSTTDGPTAVLQSDSATADL